MSGITGHGTCRSLHHHPPLGGQGGANSRPFPLPSLTHARPTPSTRFAANHLIPSPDPFPRAANKETATNSNCTIPFGLPPLPETTRTSDNRYHNEKARQRPAKRNLRPARAGENGTRQARKVYTKRFLTVFAKTMRNIHFILTINCLLFFNKF